MQAALRCADEGGRGGMWPSLPPFPPHVCAALYVRCGGRGGPRDEAGIGCGCDSGSEPGQEPGSGSAVMGRRRRLGIAAASQDRGLSPPPVCRLGFRSVSPHVLGIATNG
ncbi:hypothetical protein PLESTB_000495800 [Pleodorina starrii]|uniref:Uncharacterized protein n=1 Tax=Pleodorina starrii TaxID=330485 RepID=A0A9W6BG34_9CHLO|nr:hypothetical protein PLESTM_000367200 [Pleodorina starrii]GLC51378.1 hypothetical protein PLESTB_000495800 [Pleodorina starrii]GLC63743.1 hypothetical protein PLESTF_000069300 [Pleodorina starrii]